MVQLKKSQKFWLQTFSLICHLRKSFIWVKFHKHQKHFLMMTNDFNDVFLLGNIFSIKFFNWFSCWSLTFRKSILNCKVFFKVCRFRSVQFIWNWRLSFFFVYLKKVAIKVSLKTNSWFWASRNCQSKQVFVLPPGNWIRWLIRKIKVQSFWHNKH